MILQISLNITEQEKQELEDYIEELGFKGSRDKEKLIFLQDYLKDKNRDTESKFEMLYNYKTLLELDKGLRYVFRPIFSQKDEKYWYT